MAKFKVGPVVPKGAVDTYRLGTAANANGQQTDKETGKFQKLVGDSRYALCAAGDPIEGIQIAVAAATQDGFSLGSVQTGGRVNALCEGKQADGEGDIAVGDYVVCGTIVAKGTALTGPPKVRKATYQPGVTEITNVNQVHLMSKVAMFAWRVMSLGNAGAVGDTCVIERVHVA
jgi:hypothetical protein